MSKKNKKSRMARADERGDLLSKKERKALEAREAELAAELERRKAKADKKARKAAKAGVDPKAGKPKSKKKAKPEPSEYTKLVETADPTPDAAAKALVAEAIADRKKKGPSAKAKTEAAAERVLAEGGSKGAIESAHDAKAAAAEAGDDESDEQIKARVAAKRARRAELAALFDSIDRDDEAAVKAYNDELASLGGGKFASSNKTKAANIERLTDEPKKTRKATEEKLTVTSVEGTVGEQLLATANAEFAVTSEAMAAQVVEPVETEEGTVYQAGSAEEANAVDEPVAVDDFAKPSDAPKTDFAENGNGQYIIRRPSDGKEVGYTRATTYIACLEDTSTLTKWKMRVLLEGVAINDTPTDRGDFAGDPVVGVMRDLIHRRDLTIAKALKQDRKGKLGIGELATYVNGAWADYKKAVNKIADELLEVGGVHEKAQKGTDLHALAEVVDREGIDAVGVLLEEGKITPADFADMVAYRDALEAAGIRVVKEHIEQVVVDHDRKVAGRLDRVFMVKFPGSQRAVRVVGDLKTGRVDLGAGKIAQQLDIYANAKGYDLNTHDEIDLKLNRTKAIVVHLPAGTAKATVHVVDLVAGHKANALAAQVRAWRNEGKRAIDLKVDLATVEAGGE